MKIAITLALVSLVLAAGSLFGADTKPTKEDRQKMAEMHSKMADCLKSDKPMGDCQSEMMKSCKSMMGKEGCPMMGQMKGMMKGGMMNQGADESSKE
jgi:hypothetical protein